MDRWTVFDLDDTLYLEREFVESGFKAASRRLFEKTGVKNFEETASNLFQSGRRNLLIHEAMQLLGLDFKVELTNELIEIYRSHIPTISLLPDSIEFLSRARKESQLGLITGGRPETQRRKIEALRLMDTFQIVVFSGDRGENMDKPHPWSFAEFERNSNACKSQILYFADNPLKDFTVPMQLGWRITRVRREEGIYSSIEGSPQIPEIRNFANLLSA